MKKIIYVIPLLGLLSLTSCGDTYHGHVVSGIIDKNTKDFTRTYVTKDEFLSSITEIKEYVNSKDEKLSYGLKYNRKVDEILHKNKVNADKTTTYITSGDINVSNDLVYLVSENSIENYVYNYKDNEYVSKENKCTTNEVLYQKFNGVTYEITNLKDINNDDKLTYKKTIFNGLDPKLILQFNSNLKSMNLKILDVYNTWNYDFLNRYVVEESKENNLKSYRIENTYYLTNCFNTKNVKYVTGYEICLKNNELFKVKSSYYNKFLNDDNFYQMKKDIIEYEITDFDSNYTLDEGNKTYESETVLTYKDIKLSSEFKFF